MLCIQMYTMCILEQFYETYNVIYRVIFNYTRHDLCLTGQVKGVHTLAGSQYNFYSRLRVMVCFMWVGGGGAGVGSVEHLISSTKSGTRPLISLLS